MRDNRKKIVSLTVASVCLASAFAFTACGEKAWSLDETLSYTPSTEAAVSNGGFAVEKGGYVYYINGSAAYDGDNTFGKVEKGALKRISTENLKTGNYTETETVVPLLFAAQNYDSGIYIFGDYVYFATPTTDKDLDGNVLSDSLDFKRAKLDGSETMSTPYFRLDNNSKQYRFVQPEANGAVYCLYVDGSALKSFNTQTGKETVLVSDSSATYYFDKTDATNPTVYYTMGVKKLIDTDSAANEEYNQLYRVRVDATATVNAEEASYTVTGNGYTKTYDFDKKFLEEKNAEAKDDKKDAPYDFDDYTTYPYVNLGELVLDGIGASSELKMTQFSDKADYDAAVSDGALTELKGYTYTVQSVQNGGVYFTRSKVMKGANEIEPLYYLANSEIGASWNSVAENASLGEEGKVVALSTANASASALYTVESGVHTYYYVSDTILYKAVAPTIVSGAYTESDPLEMARVASGAVLLTMNGDNLYYRDSSNYLYSIDYTGEADDYHQLAGDRIEPVQIAAVELNTGWYGFEVFEDTVLYGNAQTVNSKAYNYVYAAKLEDADKMTTRMENYTKVSDYFTNLSDSDLTSLFRYYFRTGETKMYDAVKDLYDGYEQNEFTAFSTHAVSANKTKNDYTDMFKDESGVYYDKESYFVNLLGSYTKDDKTSVDEGFAATLKKEAAEEEEKGLAWWAIVLICVGSVLVAGGAAFIVVWQVKKAKKAKHDKEATAIRPKKKIDTTDDKSIDVYANDEEKAEEQAETETVETAVEAPVEEPVEETAEVETEPVETTEE